MLFTDKRVVWRYKRERRRIGSLVSHSLTGNPLCLRLAHTLCVTESKNPVERNGSCSFLSLSFGGSFCTACLLLLPSAPCKAYGNLGAAPAAARSLVSSLAAALVRSSLLFPRAKHQPHLLSLLTHTFLHLFPSGGWNSLLSALPFLFLSFLMK